MLNIAIPLIQPIKILVEFSQCKARTTVYLCAIKFNEIL